MRPFYVGQSGRLAAHATQYAASPAEMNNISNYGYWGPYCVRRRRCRRRHLPAVGP